MIAGCVALAAPVVAGAAGTTKKGGTVVIVKETEFKFALNRSVVPAGRVTFKVKDTGKADHEMVIIRTSKDASKLSKGSGASEAGSVGEISDEGPGQSRTQTFVLKPGHYALVCNLPGHYKAGMYSNFTVSR
jgi:uncharacterized cupredoxin-like copper-binding protein